MPLVLANTTLAVSISILSETTLSLPRPRRPGQRLLGLDPRAGLRRGRDLAGRLVVPRLPRCVRRARRARLQPHRARHRGRSSTRAESVRDGPARVRRRQRHLPRRGGADVPAVRGVTLSVDSGETLGIAGESGCGKSTLTSTVLRMQPKTAKVTGEVRLDGKDVHRHVVGQGPRAALGPGVDGVPGRDARAQPGAAHRRPDGRADPAARQGRPRAGRRPPRASASSSRWSGCPPGARGPTRTSSPAGRSSAS